MWVHATITQNGASPKNKYGDINVNILNVLSNIAWSSITDIKEKYPLTFCYFGNPVLFAKVQNAKALYQQKIFKCLTYLCLRGFLHY